MTIRAHNSRRTPSRASRQPLPTEGIGRFTYRELYPYMYKDKPKRPTRTDFADAVKAHIVAHGPSTAKEIATGLGHSDSSSVANRLRKGIAGVVIVDRTPCANGRRTAIWGVADGIPQ